MVNLEDHLSGLDLTNESKRQCYDQIVLQFNQDGRFEVNEKHAFEEIKVLTSLNKLIEIDGKVESDIVVDIDGDIKGLVDEVTPFMESLSIDDLHNVESKEIICFLQTISLMISNFQVNELIKNDIDSPLIDKMLQIYINILGILRSFELKKHSFLLTRTSFISHLLILISFAIRLKSTSSSALLKTLAILFSYFTQSSSLLDSALRLFVVNPNTNVEMFQVFNKLWESTLEVPIESQFNTNQSPGPITVINRIDALESFEISSELIHQVFPYNPSQYLYQLSQSSLKASSILINIKSGIEVSANLYELLGLVTNNLNCQVTLTILETLELSKTLLELFEDQNYRPQLGYIFTKITQSLYLKKDNILATSLLARTLNQDIPSLLETSIYDRYKVLFEVLDHNSQIDFQNDFAMSFSLEQALYNIDRDFDLQKDHSALSGLGSSLTLPAILHHIGFLLSKAVLKFQNPNKVFSKVIEENISIKKLPPLPRSDFLDFENIFISKTQQNMNNYRLVINGITHCLSILHKIIIGYTNIKNWIHPIRNIEDTDDDLEYRSIDRFLLLNYSSLFAILNVCNELSQKAQVGSDSDQSFSSLFYDLESTSNALKLQTYQIFDDLFKLYDTFAFFKLVKFIMNVSMTDLKLQKFSIKILDHLLFHSNNGLKNSVKNHDLIKKSLQQYIALWSDGSTEYAHLEEFLGFRSNPVESVVFNSNKYLDFLGFEPETIMTSLSPSTTSSSSSMPNFSYANHSNSFNATLPSTASTPNYSYVANPNNISQMNTKNNSGYFNINPNLSGSDRGFLTGGTTTPTTAGLMIDNNNYKNCNIQNVQSFIPQLFNPPTNMKKAQSVHVDQFGK